VIELLLRFDERVSGDDAGIDPERLRALDLAQLAAGVAQSTSLPTREKQALLEAGSLAERLERLAGALDFHLALLGAAPAGGSETLH
jgi:hypothetical protein